MELIEKQAAIESLNRIPRIKGMGMELLIAVPDVEKIIEGLPTVPAVPLDKLCEWLASFRAELPVAVACNYRGAKVCTDCDYMDRSLVDCWKRILTKWMEGLDDNG